MRGAGGCAGVDRGPDAAGCTTWAATFTLSTPQRGGLVPGAAGRATRDGILGAGRGLGRLSENYYKIDASILPPRSGVYLFDGDTKIPGIPILTRYGKLLDNRRILETYTTLLSGIDIDN